MLKLPYVGCKVLASSICMDKIYAKYIFERANLKQAKYIVIKANRKDENRYEYINDKIDYKRVELEEIANIVEMNLKYPVFIKPSNSGSSVGISKAENKEELIQGIKTARKFDVEILIEQGIKGKEVECAVLGTEDVEASCVGQIISADEFYDYDSKYKNAASKVIIPANIDEDTSEKIRALAIKAFKAVNGSGLARVDFFVGKENNEIYINEINTMPGFTQISMYPKLWEHSGIAYSEVLDKLIEMEK